MADIQLELDALGVFHNEWALVTAGREGDYNTMTIGWGGLGTLWSIPVATIYVKPVRYTHSFLERNDYFTVSFFPADCRKALGVLGTLSGRDGDKVTQSGLHPKYLEHGVTFEEATVTLVCKKIYRQDLDMNAMPTEMINRYYRQEAPHTMFVGQVVDILR